jgi:hypothetical protein
LEATARALLTLAQSSSNTPPELYSQLKLERRADIVLLSLSLTEAQAESLLPLLDP